MRAATKTLATRSRAHTSRAASWSAADSGRTGRRWRSTSPDCLPAARVSPRRAPRTRHSPPADRPHPIERAVRRAANCSVDRVRGPGAGPAGRGRCCRAPTWRGHAGRPRRGRGAGPRRSGGSAPPPGRGRGRRRTGHSRAGTETAKGTSTHRAASHTSVELGPLEEDPVDEQHRVRRDGDRVRAHRPVGVHVVDGRRHGLASSERIDDGPTERGVVVGVLVEGLGSTAPRDALSLRPVEAVDRDAQHVARAVHRADHLGELVGEHRLAGAVEAVDGNGDALTRPERDDAVREVAQDGIPERRAKPSRSGAAPPRLHSSR